MFGKGLRESLKYTPAIEIQGLFVLGILFQSMDAGLENRPKSGNVARYCSFKNLFGNSQLIFFFLPSSLSSSISFFFSFSPSFLLFPFLPFFLHSFCSLWLHRLKNTFFGYASCESGGLFESSHHLHSSLQVKPL